MMVVGHGVMLINDLAAHLSATDRRRALASITDHNGVSRREHIEGIHFFAEQAVMSSPYP